MKTIIQSKYLVLLFCLFTIISVIGQEENEFEPAYVVVTKMHFSSEGASDFDGWKEAELEYFNKVTDKNDLIMHSGVYVHYLTSDSSEVLFLSVYDSWSDFEIAMEINEDLIQEGWENENEREAFFEKQNSYYNGTHSDEMYSTLPFYKNMQSESEESQVIYVRKNEGKKGGSGYTEYFDNVIQKNDYIKGYFTMKHVFGSNNRDAIEVGVYDSLGDIEKSFEENEKLSEAHWPDEEERKAFFLNLNKVFGTHADFIYKNVPELAK